MKHWLDDLHDELARLEQANLLRALRPVDQDGPMLKFHGTNCVNLASNDYLGLAAHPHVREAAIRAIEQHGFGSGASRLVSGHLSTHEAVEHRFARFKHAEAALLLPSGYTANLAVLTSLAQAGDLICIDKLTHASLIDAARASGATVRVYPHLQPDKLDRLLGEHTTLQHEANTDRAARRFIVTDSVFSMDGDVADLPTLASIAERHEAILIVDEAHGTGVLGQSGTGLCELQHVTERVDIVISTASKALGGLGGIVTAKRVVIDTLINRARPFIYSTGIPAAQAAAIDAAVDVVRDEPWRRDRVLMVSALVREQAEACGLVAPLSDGQIITPIVPLITGTAESAIALSGRLTEAGFFAPAIRPPTVGANQSRVRLSLRADLDDTHIERLLVTLKACAKLGT